MIKLPKFILIFILFFVFLLEHDICAQKTLDNRLIRIHYSNSFDDIFFSCDLRSDTIEFSNVEILKNGLDYKPKSTFIVEPLLAAKFDSIIEVCFSKGVIRSQTYQGSVSESDEKLSIYVLINDLPYYTLKVSDRFSEHSYTFNENFYYLRGLIYKLIDENY